MPSLLLPALLPPPPHHLLPPGPLGGRLLVLTSASQAQAHTGPAGAELAVTVAGIPYGMFVTVCTSSNLAWIQQDWAVNHLVVQLSCCVLREVDHCEIRNLDQMGPCLVRKGFFSSALMCSTGFPSCTDNHFVCIARLFLLTYFWADTCTPSNTSNRKSVLLFF